MESAVYNPGKLDRGLIMDPRTKLALLITVTTFALGGAGDRRCGMLVPVLCMVPFLLLLTAKRFKTAIIGIVLFWGSSMLLTFANAHDLKGIIYYIILGSCGVLGRFLPCIMMGRYLMESTTVSEFTAAMKKLHVSDNFIIPLSVMFRFFPTVVDEADSISCAMKMRGINIGGETCFQDYRVQDGSSYDLLCKYRRGTISSSSYKRSWRRGEKN